MLPYRDDLSDGPRGRASLAIAAVLFISNLPLFLLDTWRKKLFGSLSFVPVEFSLQPFINSYRLVTATFLHGDVFHLLGNCLFLVVFGTSLERLFGWRRFLLLFPILGVAGFLVEWVLHPDSFASVIGSSGAVAAFMGAYLPLFPRARIRVIAFWGFMWKRFSVPAWLFLFYWIGSQVLPILRGSEDGIAYGVHIGSFIAGSIGAIVWKTSYPLAEEYLELMWQAR